MAKELKISALTVKKAYDNLEAEGMTVTVHGKRNLCCSFEYTVDGKKSAEKKEVEDGSGSGDSEGKHAARMKGEEIRSLFETDHGGRIIMLDIKGVKKSYGEFQLDCSLNVEKRKDHRSGRRERSR